MQENIKLIKSKVVQGISFGQMRDGQIAIIVDFPIERYIGSIVQKNGGNLFKIGGTDFWTELNAKNTLEWKFQLLENGDVLEILKN